MAYPVAPPARGMAISALVCGITGTVVGLIPILAVPALALGVVVLVLGLLAVRKQKQARVSRGMARAGWLLGLVAVVLAIIGFAVVTSAVNELERDLNELQIERLSDGRDASVR